MTTLPSVHTKKSKDYPIGITMPNSTSIQYVSAEKYKSLVLNSLFDFTTENTLNLSDLFKAENINEHMQCKQICIADGLKKEAYDAIFTHFTELQKLYPLTVLNKVNNEFSIPFHKIIKNEDGTLSAMVVTESLLLFTPQEIAEGKQWESTVNAALLFNRETFVMSNIQKHFDNLFFISVLKYLDSLGLASDQSLNLKEHNYKSMITYNGYSFLNGYVEFDIIWHILYDSFKNTYTNKKVFNQAIAHKTLTPLSQNIYAHHSETNRGMILNHKNKLYVLPFTQGKNKKIMLSTSDKMCADTETIYIYDSFKNYHGLVSKNVNFFKKFKWVAMFAKNINELLHPELKTYFYRYLKIATVYTLGTGISLNSYNKMLSERDIFNKLMSTNSAFFVWFMQYYVNTDYRALSSNTNNTVDKPLTLNAVADLKHLLISANLHWNDKKFTEKMWKDLTKLNTNLMGYLLSLATKWLNRVNSTNTDLIQSLHIITCFLEHGHTPSLMMINRLFVINYSNDLIKQIVRPTTEHNALNKQMIKFIMNNYGIAKKKRKVKEFCNEFSLILDYWNNIPNQQLMTLFKRKTTLLQFVNLHNEWTAETIRVSNEFKDKQAHYEWHPLIDDIELNSFKIKGLNTGKSLIEEGKAMNHCVSSYISTCLKGKSRIFSIVEPNTDVKLVTVEIIRSYNDNTFKVAQVRGYNNQMINHKKEAISTTLQQKLNRTASKLCEMINKIENTENLLNEIYLNDGERKPVSIESFTRCMSAYHF